MANDEIAQASNSGNANSSGGSNNTHVMSRSIGTAPEYKTGEDWNLYIERLDQFFIANFVEENRKVSVLITVIGADTYKVLRELCDPILPNTLNYEQVCNTLKKTVLS